MRVSTSLPSITRRNGLVSLSHHTLDYRFYHALVFLFYHASVSLFYHALASLLYHALDLTQSFATLMVILRLQGVSASVSMIYGNYINVTAINYYKRLNYM